MVGRRGGSGRELACLQARLRGDPGGSPVAGFLEGLAGGLLLGAALALIATQRGAVAADAPLGEASVELKGYAARLAQGERERAGAVAGQTDALTDQANAALDRLVAGEETTAR